MLQNWPKYQQTYFCKKICRLELSKTAQCGHPGLNHPQLSNNNNNAKELVWLTRGAPVASANNYLPISAFNVTMFIHIFRVCQDQCDQMAVLFFQYLAIFYDENLHKKA